MNLGIDRLKTVMELSQRLTTILRQFVSRLEAIETRVVNTAGIEDGAITGPKLGVGAGNIVEEGSNSNGSWVKFETGLMICTLNILVFDQAISTPYFSIFQGSRQWVFPQEFVGSPTVNCSSFRWGTSASWGTIASIPTNVSVFLRGMDFGSRAAGTQTLVQATAIGRWK